MGLKPFKLRRRRRDDGKTSFLVPTGRNMQVWTALATFAVIILFLMGALILAGCSTPHPVQVTPIVPVGDGILRVEPFPKGTIIIATEERLQAEYEKLGGEETVTGFWDNVNGFLWVPKASRSSVTSQPQVDKHRNILPDFGTLGHELIHHSRGYWHE